MNISISIGCGVIEYTGAELEKEISDLIFLRDAVLVLLNPQVCESSDLPYNREQVVSMLQDMYKEGRSYSQEFIKQVFQSNP